MGASRIETYMFSDTHQKLFKDSFTMIQIYLFGTLCRIKKTSIYTFSILVFTCFKENSCWGMLRPYHDCHGVCPPRSPTLGGNLRLPNATAIPVPQKKSWKKQVSDGKAPNQNVGIYVGIYIGYWMILDDIDWDIGMSQVGNSWSCLKMPKCTSTLLLVLGQLPRGATPGRHGLVAKGPSSPAFAELPGSDVLYNVVGEPKSCKHISCVYCEYGIVK